MTNEPETDLRAQLHRKLDEWLDSMVERHTGPSIFDRSSIEFAAYDIQWDDDGCPYFDVQVEEKTNPREISGRLPFKAWQDGDGR